MGSASSLPIESTDVEEESVFSLSKDLQGMIHTYQLLLAFQAIAPNKFCRLPCRKNDQGL